MQRVEISTVLHERRSSFGAKVIELCVRIWNTVKIIFDPNYYKAFSACFCPKAQFSTYKDLARVRNLTANSQVMAEVLGLPKNERYFQPNQGAADALIQLSKRMYPKVNFSAEDMLLFCSSNSAMEIQRAFVRFQPNLSFGRMKTQYFKTGMKFAPCVRLSIP